MFSIMNHSEESLKKCFQAIDTDGSGEISGSELKKLFKNMGYTEKAAEDCAKVRKREFVDTFAIVDKTC